MEKKIKPKKKSKMAIKIDKLQVISKKVLQEIEQIKSDRSKGDKKA